MAEHWLKEYERAERLLRDLATRRVDENSAASVTLARAQSNQISTILMLLDRGVPRITDPGERRRCSDLADSLRRELRRVEISLRLAEDEDSSFRGQLTRQDRRLESLHSSVRSLKSIGQEINAEIDEHMSLLADLEDRTTVIATKQLGIRDRLVQVTAAGLGLCSLYLIVVVLGVILVQLILTLS
jgi:septal ring factor EnvC (AmiA/AmiB activator)